MAATGEAAVGVLAAVDAGAAAVDAVAAVVDADVVVPVVAAMAGLGTKPFATDLHGFSRIHNWTRAATSVAAFFYVLPRVSFFPPLRGIGRC